MAGLRGIGTWGAGECIKKEWQQIFDKLPSKDKGCEFSALLFFKGYVVMIRVAPSLAQRGILFLCNRFYAILIDPSIS